MVRVFENLLVNAIKFRRKGEPARVHITAECVDEEWLIRVTDNGIGFPPEHAHKIFNPFERLHRTREYPGSGIGLAACKRIVEEYGGRIGAESRPGEGSTFWFTVPVTASDQTRFALQVPLGSRSNRGPGALMSLISRSGWPAYTRSKSPHTGMSSLYRSQHDLQGSLTQIAELGGTLAIQSNPDGRTRTTANLPVTQVL